MEKNSRIFDHLMAIADDVKPQLAWNATTPGKALFLVNGDGL